MNADFFISLSAILFSSTLAVFVFRQNPRDFVHRIFTAGMLVLAVESGLVLLSLLSDSAATALRFQRFRFLVGGLLPGVWLTFSLAFARSNFKDFLRRWQWVILLTVSLPVAMAAFSGNAFILQPALLMGSQGDWILKLGWSGYLYHVLSLIGAVLVLIHLEKTLRTSTGVIRAQIKFMILGVGGIFCVRIYTDSQALLFHAFNTSLMTVNGIALLIACTLMVISLRRSQKMTVNIYLSHSFLYVSFTVLFVGLYLIAVALIIRTLPLPGGEKSIPLQSFLVFVLFLCLAVFLLSARVREHVKSFVSRHLNRPLYDYRKEWTTFTRTAGSLLDMNTLCYQVADMISRTLDVGSVSLWVMDGSEERLVLTGSTALSMNDVSHSGTSEEVLLALAGEIQADKIPVFYDYSTDRRNLLAHLQNQELCSHVKFRYAVPLVSGNQLVGLMTVGERISGDALSLEDFELLKTIADQASVSLLTIKLSENLRELKELEAFQTMSAFFVHDLKKLASKLSLMMQNLPIHFDNEEFRNDTLQMMSQSIAKINVMCGRLSSLSEKIELRTAAVDLNELVEATLAGFNGNLKARVVKDLKPLPKLLLDPEQIQKVLVNLLLNANDAVADDPLISIRTGCRGHWVELSVRENGGGISKEFIEKSLFRPFKTTKKNGMGIGLFHSKMIVEAHRGRLEAESIEGRETTFHVLLPVSEIDSALMKLLNPSRNYHLISSR